MPLVLALVLSLLHGQIGQAQSGTSCGGFQGFNLGGFNFPPGGGNFQSGGFNVQGGSFQQGGFQGGNFGGQFNSGGFQGLNFGGQFQGGGFQGGQFNGGFNFGGGGFQGGFQGINFGAGGINFNGAFQPLGFNFGGAPGCGSGVFGLIPDAAIASPGGSTNFRLIWVVTSGWQDLEYIDLRVRLGNRTVIIRWFETTDTYALIDPVSGLALATGRGGDARPLVGDFLELDLKGTSSANSGPTGQAAGINLELDLKGVADGQVLQIDAGAKLDGSAPTPYELAAILYVFTPNAQNNAANNDNEKDRKLTEEQHQQRERTNRANLDDYRTEGNAVSSACDASIPTVTIANRDGNVVLQLSHDAKLACGSVRPGDYIEATGDKQHEQLYDVDQMTVRRIGTRVR